MATVLDHASGGSARPEPSWFPDPTGRNDLRYWNGHAWTAHTLTHGHLRQDPIGQGDASVPAGWLPDPTGQNDVRYWDGHAWTVDALKDGQPRQDQPWSSMPKAVPASGRAESAVVAGVGLVSALVALGGPIALAASPWGRDWLLPGVLLGLVLTMLAQLSGWSGVLRAGSTPRDRLVGWVTLAISSLTVVAVVGLLLFSSSNLTEL